MEVIYCHAQLARLLQLLCNPFLLILKPNVKKSKPYVNPFRDIMPMTADLGYKRPKH